MSLSLTIPATLPRHDHSCETAGNPDCKCYCNGAGHQRDLLIRTVTCSSLGALAELSRDLERCYGGFHSSRQDVLTRTRPGRNVPTRAEAAVMGSSTGRGASWFEQLVLDEALHAAFLQVAKQSLSTSPAQRQAQALLIAHATSDAIPVIGSATAASTVVDPHVWCSILTLHCAPSTPSTREAARICYPRKSAGRVSPLFTAHVTAGLSHLSALSTTLPSNVQSDLLALVGAATCPDLWRHPGAVRWCLGHLVSNPHFPPAGTTTLGTRTNFADLEARWAKRGNW